MIRLLYGTYRLLVQWVGVGTLMVLPGVQLRIYCNDKRPGMTWYAYVGDIRNVYELPK